MSPLHPTCAAFLALLFFGLGVHAAETKSKEELESGADKFVHGYDADWNKRYPGNVKTFAEEVAKVCQCDEATTKALIEGTKPIGEKTLAHWRAVYRVYYFTHYEDYSNGAFWDDYAEMLATDECRNGVRELGEMWEALLSAKLTPAQYQLWQDEMKVRLERHAKARGPNLDAQLERSEQAVRKGFEARCDAIVRDAAMPRERAELLRPVVDAAVRACMEIRRAKGEMTVRLWADDFTSYREASLTNLEKKTVKGDIVNSTVGQKAANKVFDEAVKKLLLPDEQAKLKDQKEQMTVRVTKIAKDMAERVLDQQLAQSKSQQTAKIERLSSTLKLDEERRKALEKELAAAERKISDDWKASFVPTTIKSIQRSVGNSGDSESRLKQMEMGRYGFSDEAADAKAITARRDVWLAALKSMLKPDEQARWQLVEQQLCEQRSRILAHMAVAELDRSLLLQPEQRAAIEKLALEAAKPLGALPGNLTDIWQGNLSGALVLLHAIGLPKVDALLDASQKKDLPRLAENCDYQWQRLKNQLPKKP